MLKVDQIEEIRRAYFIEGKSIRRIAREGHHDRFRWSPFSLPFLFKMVPFYYAENTIQRSEVEPLLEVR